MAKFLQKNCLMSISSLPIFVKPMKIVPQFDILLQRHISIPRCNLGMNFNKSGDYLLENVLKGTLIQSNICRKLKTAPNYQKNFYTVTFALGSGKKYTVKGKEDDTMLDIVKNNNVDILGYGACEGTISCSTCHLIFKREDFDKIDIPLTDEELDILTTARDFTDTSRLGCQVCLTKELDGVEVQVPEHVIDARTS